MAKVVHFEIPFDDAERAQNFYQPIFGWEMSNIADTDYTFVNTVPVDVNQTPTEPGAFNGGLTLRDAPGETPLLVISFSAVNECIAKVKDTGRKLVLPKIKVGKMGLYARV